MPKTGLKMKKQMFSILLGLSVLTPSFASTNAPINKVTVDQTFIPVEGKEYSLLETPLQNAETIIEFFSFNCHSCYNYQYVYQIPTQLHQKLKNSETYRYVNIDGLLNAGTITQAWAMGEEMKKQNEVINEMYYGLQTKKNIKGADDIKSLFMHQFNLTEDQFFDLWDSKAVTQNKEAQLELAKQAKITKTPTFIVKGKYRIEPQNFDAKSHEDYVQKFISTIEYLKDK